MSLRYDQETSRETGKFHRLFRPLIVLTQPATIVA